MGDVFVVVVVVALCCINNTGVLPSVCLVSFMASCVFDTSRVLLISLPIAYSGFHLSVLIVLCRFAEQAYNFIASNNIYQLLHFPLCLIVFYFLLTVCYLDLLFLLLLEGSSLVQILHICREL